MATVGRNDPCPCGSENKFKRCCSSPERLALEGLSSEVAADLAYVGSAELVELLEQAKESFQCEESLQVHLPMPSILSCASSLARAGSDDAAHQEAAWGMVRHLDTTERRLRLAHAIIALRDAGEVAPELAAAAVVHLHVTANSALVLSSIRNSLAAMIRRAEASSGVTVSAA
jgi:hypothetical protein